VYSNGQGVPQDDPAAASWYRKAADQGYVAAQYYLGSMYFDGQDYVSAHMWFNLAATCRRENEPGTDCRSAEDGPRMESGIYSTLDGWCIARRRAQIHGARRG
jgi:Sel1 repeat